MPAALGNFRRVCAVDGCELEAAPRKQKCYEDWLRDQPPIVRQEAAERRSALIPTEARRATIPAAEWPPGRRWCAGCQTFVRVEDCTGSRCKPCAAIASHKVRTKSNFGIDADTYQWLLQLQHGKCAICRTRPRTTRLALDHDHKHCKSGCPKCVRGLLCKSCNHDLLGAAHDSINILRNAVAYLERTPMSGEWEIPEYERQLWAAENPGEPVAPF